MWTVISSIINNKNRVLASSQMTHLQPSQSCTAGICKKYYSSPTGTLWRLHVFISDIYKYPLFIIRIWFYWSRLNILIFLQILGWEYSCENFYTMAHDISVLECLWCLDGSWMFLGVTSNFAISLRRHFKTPDMR